MKWLLMSVVAAGLLAGCNYEEAPKAKGGAEAKSVADAVAPTIEYVEGKVKNRIVVVGTKKGAEALAKGSEPGMAVTKIGYGPNGETVKFEADAASPVLETKLIAEYDRRHPK